MSSSLAVERMRRQARRPFLSANCVKAGTFRIRALHSVEQLEAMENIGSLKQFADRLNVTSECDRTLLPLTLRITITN